MAILASGALVLIYLAVVLAVLKLRRQIPVAGEKPFTIPGGYVVPVFALLTIGYALSNLAQKEIISILVFIAILCLLYWVVKRQRNKP